MRLTLNVYTDTNGEERVIAHVLGDSPVAELDNDISDLRASPYGRYAEFDAGHNCATARILVERLAERVVVLEKRLAEIERD